MPNETTCTNPTAYRYTWPGRDEATICEEHSHKLKAIADAMGLPLQLIPCDEGTCQQKVSG